MSEGFSIEQWIRNQIESDPEIIEQYGVTITPGGMKIGKYDLAVFDYKAQNNADWHKWHKYEEAMQAR